MLENKTGRHLRLLGGALWCVLVCCGTNSTSSTHVRVGGASSKANLSDVRVGTSHVFKVVPADSIFVFASLDSRVGLVPALIRFLKPIISGVLEEGLTATDEQRNLRTVSKILEKEGLVEIGFDPTPHFLMYMIGTTFVARLNLNDGDALEAFIRKTSEERNAVIEFKTEGEWRYFELPREDGKVGIIAIREHEVLFSIMRSTDRKRVFPMVLGSVLPKQSLADTGLLDTLKHRYGGQSIGYVDTERFFQLMAGDTLGAEKSFAQLSKVCFSEIHSLVSVVPRVVMSFEQSSQNQFSFHAAVELRSDVASELKRIAKPVPGLSILEQQPDSLTMGIGIDARALSESIRRIGLNIKQNPYRCEKLAGLNGLSSFSSMLNLVPPIVTELSGVVVSVDSLDRDDPSHMSGVLAAGSHDPQILFNYVKSMVPEIFGDIRLQTDGIATPMDTEKLGLDTSISLAMGPSMIGISSGDNTELLSELVLEPEADSGPFFYMNYDYSKWRHLFSETVNDFDQPLAVTEVLSKFAASLGRTGYFVYATEFGIFSTMSLELN